MDPRFLPKGKAEIEQQGDSRPENRPGVYFHEGAAKFVETTRDPRAGRIQGDGLVQVGYRAASEKEVEEYRKMKEAEAKARRIEETRTTTVLSSKER